MFKKIIVQKCYFNVTEELAKQFADQLDLNPDETYLREKFLNGDVVHKRSKTGVDDAYCVTTYCLEEQKVKR